jgi:hypothetical protein
MVAPDDAPWASLAIVLGAQPRDDSISGRRARRDAVEQDHDGAAAGRAVAVPPSVDLDLEARHGRGRGQKRSHRREDGEPDRRAQGESHEIILGSELEALRARDEAEGGPFPLRRR